MPHLFERFYRGKAGHDFRGTGDRSRVGDSETSRGDSQGKIKVENDPLNHGAIFTIWLPEKQLQEAS